MTTHSPEDVRLTEAELTALTQAAQSPVLSVQGAVERIVAERTSDMRDELAGAIATITHLQEGMGWIAGHDRRGLDHLEDAIKACAERDAAEERLGRVEALADEWDAQGDALWDKHSGDVGDPKSELLASTRHNHATWLRQRLRDEPECSCAMTEGSQRTCPQHGEDQWLDPRSRDGATDA